MGAQVYMLDPAGRRVLDLGKEWWPLAVSLRDGAAAGLHPLPADFLEGWAFLTDRPWLVEVAREFVETAAGAVFVCDDNPEPCLLESALWEARWPVFDPWNRNGPRTLAGCGVSDGIRCG